jgi:hypothetical protein
MCDHYTRDPSHNERHGEPAKPTPPPHPHPPLPQIPQRDVTDVKERAEGLAADVA